LGIIIKLLLLWGLIKLLIETNSPLLCAGIYAGAAFIFSVVSGLSLGPLLLGTAISFALAYVYFWLLDRFHGYTIVFGLIAVLGALIALL
jgi:hypothetical protein